MAIFADANQSLKDLFVGAVILEKGGYGDDKFRIMSIDVPTGSPLNARYFTVEKLAE